MHAISHALRAAALALMAALVGALAACQSAAPQPPLLSSLDQAKRYGYADRTLGPDRLEVAYFGPRRVLTSFSPNPSDAETQPARAEAADLATWHAADVALGRGFKGFRIVDRDIHVDSAPGAFSFGSGMDPVPTWRYPGGFIYGPQFYAAPANAYVQVRATLTVELRNELTPGDYDAAATIERLRAAYPRAEIESARRAP